MSEKLYRVQMNSKGMPDFSTAVEVADRPSGEWIPCCERLPEKNGDYLVTSEWIGQSGTKYIEMRIASFERKRWAFNYQTVIAWMPLPEPYMEVE